MRSHSISIRFTETEWRLLKEQAEREGRSVSNMIRVALFNPTSGRIRSRVDGVGQVLPDVLRTVP
jgi:hypothetical protein